jgi:hypothetical protein
MRLKNNRVQPTRFRYMGKKGVSSVVIPAYGTIDLGDFVSFVSEGQLNNGWIEIISEEQIKMMNAERDALSYMEKKTK